jgi:leucyl/phenylalanyl-tRNA--protein transferase
LDPLLPKQVRYQAALHADKLYSNRMSTPQIQLPWLEPGDLFPSVEKAWTLASDAPGLLAAGADLSVPTLLQAYANGIFPWFNEGQPILWWSTEPRMVLQIDSFQLHRSLRRKIQKFVREPRFEIRIDTAFRQVIEACANSDRKGHPGTWIVPDMVNAYIRLHEAGHAHSVETWIDGQLAGGLYCVAIGRAVYGESMFTRTPDGSKIALAALVAHCREHAVAMVDCQQETSHLASLGAAPIARKDFVLRTQEASSMSPIPWEFSPLYWSHLLGH